jgi:hypothetical protein
MERDFADEYREAEGGRARRRFLLRALVDVLATSPGELARGLRQDLRHALRLYRNSLGSSAIAVAVLAIGMAFVGAFLSLYVDLALRPHGGFEQSISLATIGQNDGTQLLGVPYRIVERIADEMTSIEAAVLATSTNTLVGPEREGTSTELVSAQFFSGLRPRIVLGRGFVTEEHSPDAEPVAVISHRFWQTRFGGDPGILGTALEVSRDGRTLYLGEGSPFGGAPEQDSARFRIVGIMAETLPGLSQPETALWLPLERAWPLFAGAAERMAGAALGQAYVRRPTGVTVEAVTRELNARYAGADPDPTLSGGATLVAIEGIARDINVQRDARRQIELFLVGSALLALVAAANVSLFLLARAPGRRRELGIRLAVGAPLRRIARQLGTEAVFLVVVSAGLGLLLSIWLNEYLRSLTFLSAAEWRNVTLLDWRVLGFAAAFMLVLAVLVSLAPTIGLKRLAIATSSRVVAARATLAQRVAGNAQVAVAATLAGVAIAFGWYLVSLVFGDPGYETADRYLVEYSGPILLESGESAFVELARRREVIESIPGVTAVTFGGPVPGEDRAFTFPAQIPDPNDSTNQIAVHTGMIDSRFIDVLGLDLIYGRAPEERESDTVLVNQALARALWGREDVVGELLPVAIRRLASEGAEVIGVLADLSFGHPAAAVDRFVFSSSLLGISLAGSAVIESGLTRAELHEALGRLIAAGELEIQVSDVHPLGVLRNNLLSADRARTYLTIFTSSLVVFLAAFGFYGTQRYLVASGRREYAIRASLGAGPSALGRLVLLRGLLLGTPGLVTGGLLAFVAVAWLRDDFISSEIVPSLVTIWVLAGLTFILLVASLGPAREARRTQPAPLLREV